MAQMLAPYNNSMRLGQGFCSYTQEVCLDKAVLESIPRKRGQRLRQPASDEVISRESQERSSTDNEAEDEYDDQYYADARGNEVAVRGPAQPPAPVAETWVKPQIVTYSSRFVDKLSDVTDAMNISGSLSIKTSTIGGKASGSYVDSDKFKESDINFHLQVKVNNQIDNPRKFDRFNKLESVKKEEFSEIYGDSFISGWEEGGELNAIISMKVHDKSKIFEVKVSLEAELTMGAVSGSVKGNFEMEKKKIEKSGETTVTVNWAGGGSIKPTDADWTIDTLKRAAAAFPDMVAVTPQRTYAILTKYTSLASFHALKTDFSPLEYENAGIYTGSLLDSYMDYKALWKQISYATYELENNRATIDMGSPNEDIYALARISSMPEGQKLGQNQRPRLLTTGDPMSGDQQLTKSSSGGLDEKGLPFLKVLANGQLQYPVMKPSFAGLIAAKKVCRYEMSKIVHEVDLVAKNPEISIDTNRDSFFLNPLVFKQLLPVVRTLSPEDAKLGVKDPHATIILGFEEPKQYTRTLPQVYKLEADLDKHAQVLKSEFQLMAHRALYYRMQGCAGNFTDGTYQFVNDLKHSDATHRLTQVSVWFDGTVVNGIKGQYANAMPERIHGYCNDSTKHILRLADDGSEIITEVAVKVATATNGVVTIAGVSLATSLGQVLDTSVFENTAPTSGEAPKKVDTILWSKPDDAQWSLRGFFSFVDATSIAMLGVVWGRDAFVPLLSATISSPICNHLLSLGPVLRETVRDIKSSPNSQVYSDNFLIGKPASSPVAGTSVKPTEHFNPIGKIDVTWRLSNVAFSSKNGKLTGLKVTYRNGKWFTYGKYTAETESWTVAIKSELAIAKLTAGKLAANSTDEGHIDTVEFVRAMPQPGNDVAVPFWPFDVATVRYLGEGGARVTADVNEVVEPAPKIGNAAWSVRGFYGELGALGYITKLGVVWGRG